MKPNYTKLALPGLLVAGLFLIQKASATTVTAMNSDDGFPAHLVTWTDSSGNSRSAMMIDQNSSGGGPYTGYLRQYTYQYNGSPRICTGFYSAADGDANLYEFSGDGFVQNHTAADNDFSTGNSPGQKGTTTVTNFGNHVIIEYDIPNYEIDGPYYNPVAQNVPTTVQWFFADGRDNPIFAISQDASQTGGNLGADSRSPYGDMCYDGYESYWGFHDGNCGNNTYNANVGGVSYGDTYKFVTPDGGYITLNSSWEDTVPNTIPYAMQWAQDDNTDGATPVDAEWGHVATLPGSVLDQGEDPTADPSTDPRDTTGTSMIPDTTWAYQIMAYLWPTENGDTNPDPINDPVQEKKVTWGRNFGSVGGFYNNGVGGNADPLNYNPHWTDPLGEQYEGTPRKDGSVMEYSVFDVFGPHGTPSSTAYQTGAVGQVVTQMENVALSTLSVSTGTKVTSGPAGVGNTTAALAKTITYSPAGYNPTYSAWEISAANNAVNATLTPEANKPLTTPLFIIDNYTFSQLPFSITVNGNSFGYYASLDTHNQRLFITASATASSGTPLNLIVNPTAVPAPTISSLSISAGTVGTPVTINGQNFSGTTPVEYTVIAITFSGGVSSTIANVTATSVQTTVPVGAVTGPITVTTVGGGSATSATSFSPLYTLSLSSSPSADGTVTAAGLGSGETESGSIAGGPETLTATANDGYLFTDWSLGGNTVSTNPSFNITLTNSETYVAHFVTAYTLDLNNLTPADGTLTGGGVFAAGTTATVTATPYSGYVFSNWTEGVTVESTSSSYNVLVNGDIILDGTFAPIPPPLLGVLNGATIITNNEVNVVNFGKIEQNFPGSIVTFTVTNSGGETLDLTTPTLPAGFILLTNLPATLAPATSGTFAVQLNTAIAGTNSGNIIITNNDNNVATSTFVFPIAGVIYNDIISLTGNLAFGGVAIGSSAQSTLTISNLGNTNLVVSNLTYPAGFTANWTNGTIAPGASQAVTLTFSPVIASNYSGSVTIISDSSSGIGAIPVSGYGANGSLVLTVLTSGEGTVQPDLNGQTLVAGTRRTLRAIPTPGSGYIFAGWTGSTNSNKNPLTFTMATSTLLEANFIPNPFPAFAGTYNGIFSATNGVTEQTAGMLKGLKLSSKGTYSATLLIDGETKGFSGTFEANGQITNIIARPASLGDLQVVMTLTSNYPAAQIIGTVSGTNQGVGWVANLVADLATNTVPSGEYTMLIPPDASNAPPTGSPGGDGYASITNYAGTAKNPASADVKITGALADGTVFSETTSVSQNGFVPIYASLYNGKGLLLGKVNLEMTNITGVSLTWIHPARTTGLYQSGFVNLLLTNQILLSAWTNTPADISVPTDVSLSDTIYDTNTQASIAVTTTGAGKISGASVKGTINPKTGMVTATIVSGKSAVTSYGAILQNNGTNSGGYYLTKTQAEAFEIRP